MFSARKFGQNTVRDDHQQGFRHFCPRRRVNGEKDGKESKDVNLSEYVCETFKNYVSQPHLRLVDHVSNNRVFIAQIIVAGAVHRQFEYHKKQEAESKGQRQSMIQTLDIASIPAKYWEEFTMALAEEQLRRSFKTTETVKLTTSKETDDFVFKLLAFPNFQLFTEQFISPTVQQFYDDLRHKGRVLAC